MRSLAFLLFIMPLMAWPQALIEKVLGSSVAFSQMVGSEFLMPASDNSVLLFGSLNISDPFIAKIDSAGNQVWNRGYKVCSEVFLSDNEFTDAVELSDSTILVTGYTGDTLGASYARRPFCMKLKPDGDTVWSRIYGYSADHMLPYDIAVTPDSGAIICGDTDFGGASGFVMKIDKNGNIEWATTITGFIPTTSVPKGSTGTFLCGIYRVGLNNVYNPAMIRIDSVGSFMWGFKYSTGGTGIYQATDMVSDGPNFVMAVTSGAPGLLKVDSAGNLIWAHHYNKSFYDPNIYHPNPFEHDARIRHAPGNSYLLSLKGQIEVAYGILVNSSGQSQKAFTSFYEKSDLVFYKNGKIHMTINPSSIVVRSQMPGGDSEIGINIFPLSFTGTHGDCIYAEYPDTQPISYVQTTINCTTAPASLWQANLQPTVAVAQLSITPGCLSFPVKLDEQSASSISVSPNPAEDFIYVSAQGAHLPLSVTLIDLSGSLVLDNEYAGSPEPIDIRHLPAGLYFYRIGDYTHSYASGKLLIAK